MEVLGDGADQGLGRLHRGHLLSEKAVENRPPCIAALKGVLDLEDLEHIVRETNRQLGAVGVVRVPLGHGGLAAVTAEAVPVVPVATPGVQGKGSRAGVLFAVDPDVRVQLAVDAYKAVTRPLRRSCLEIEVAVRLALKARKALPHEIQDPDGEFDPFGLGQVVAVEVVQGVVHTDDPDRGEVVAPVLTPGGLDVPQVETAVGVQTLLTEALQNLPFHNQAFLGQLHPA